MVIWKAGGTIYVSYMYVHVQSRWGGHVTVNAGGCGTALGIPSLYCPGEETSCTKGQWQRLWVNGFLTAWYDTICYAMLCYILICYVMIWWILWYIMISYDIMIYYAMLWYDMNHDELWYELYDVLCHVMICYDMLWCVCVMIWYVTIMIWMQNHIWLTY